jgi:hypothetical protein
MWRLKPTASGIVLPGSGLKDDDLTGDVGATFLQNK